MKIFLPVLMSVALATGSTYAAPAGMRADAMKPSTPGRKMKLTIGQREFSATLESNEAAAAFRALLPLTLDMHDVNQNEKAHNLPSRLPSADANPRTIRNGDLMLWSSRTVVVFYRSFSTSYRYTRLGRIDDPDGLAAALGTGDVTVKLELQ